MTQTRRAACVATILGVLTFGAEIRAENSTQPEPISVGVESAILMALRQNRSLRVEALSPDIRRTGESVERAAFDPLLKGSVTVSRDRDRAVGRDPVNLTATADEVEAAVSVEEFLPTGTRLVVEGSASVLDSTLYDDAFATARVGVTATQALLRGLSLRANLARLRQARLDSRLSDYELRAFIETLVADVEKTYWDYALAESQRAIVEEALQVALKQSEETRERVKVGRISESEMAAADAEVATRREELIDAESDREKRRMALLRLINPPAPDLWDRPVALTDRPLLPETTLDAPAQHEAVALRMRPELNQARLDLERGELEVVYTKDGLLPKLDFFVTLGATGYGRAVERAARRVDGEHYDASAGLTFEVPPLNRAARAEHQRAVLTRQQLVRALENLEQSVALETRTACIEVRRAHDQVAATSATRKLREDSLWAESEKFRLGKSTSFLVAQAQRDLLDSRLKEVEAVVTYLKALVDLFRVEGSLIERRGLNVAGRLGAPAPVE